MSRFLITSIVLLASCGLVQAGCLTGCRTAVAHYTAPYFEKVQFVAVEPAYPIGSYALTASPYDVNLVGEVQRAELRRRAADANAAAFQAELAALRQEVTELRQALAGGVRPAQPTQPTQPTQPIVT